MWKAAQKRVNEEDDRLNRKPRSNTDTAEPTLQTSIIHEDDAGADDDYCSNRLRAQATHDRIVGEAMNQCYRLSSQTAHNNSNSSPNPPY